MGPNATIIHIAVRFRYYTNGPNCRLFQQLGPLVCAPGWPATARENEDSDTYGRLDLLLRVNIGAVGISLFGGRHIFTRLEVEPGAILAAISFH
jgi:hypothetical protein